MCEICEEQFDVMTEHFDKFLAERQEAIKTGLTRNTPAKRVHDLAFSIVGSSRSTKSDEVIMFWFLALAVERLMGGRHRAQGE